MRQPTQLQLALTEDSDAEFSDDETSPLTEGTDLGQPGETKGWDAFRTIPPSITSLSDGTEDFFDVAVKFLKVFTYFLTFGVVLTAAVMAKGLVFFMTSQLKKNKQLPICSKTNLGSLSQEKEYMATLPKEENVAWAWMLFFSFLVPQIFTLFRSSRMCFFKSWKTPRFPDFLWVFLFESLHTLGCGILIYIVLPEMDVIKGVMITNCLSIVPGILGFFSRTPNESYLKLKQGFDIVSVICQLTGLFVWPLVVTSNGNNAWKLWLIAPAIILISFGWWENYVDKKSKFGVIKYFGCIKERLWKTRYFCYMLISIWKSLIFFTVMVLAMGFQLDDFDAVFDLDKAFEQHPINVTEMRKNLPSATIPDFPSVVPDDNNTFIISSENTPLYVFLIQILTAWVCYIFGKFACKICIQGFSFAFPVNLTVPVTIALLITACGLRYDDPCALKDIPTYLFWDFNNGNILSDFVTKDFSWVWILWLLSQTWITIHIWIPKSERLASTEKLFVRPMYNSLFIDQCVALNRRRDNDYEMKTEDLVLHTNNDDKDLSQYYDTISVHTDSSSNSPGKIKSSDQITRIYAVATMWHETADEMMEYLKSILRMDEDQCARRVAQKYLRVVDPDYFEFETHIFFDDAFEVSDDNEDENVVNQFVKLMVDIMDEAATHVHQTNIRIRPPKKYPTPYGGRLVWTLPGKTKIVVHLKDKSKIRHKKRWSQVMYMYYLLGFKLMDQSIPVDRKEVIAENTYLLALDGDIDFSPAAVALLVDLMKKNSNLGAACGRIHPVGSGLMVWYQMFEYAIGHWLQKATEHMIGCVLCSPGCFSLFRGKALMDDNVMAKYTTISSQARHYVQYDQGEDRWLCTLLLQRGYRVEYSAASDAYTHAPEGFSEFYNQRRRWVPSTMANIMDLLEDSGKTIAINDNISLPYIVYQSSLLVGTILGPGTIFLMIVGAFTAAFPQMTNSTSFLYNFIPILVFMLACFFLKSPMQISIAYALTVVYALVMVIVLVSMMITFSEEGWLSPSSLFFFATAGSFIFTGILHPKEIICLPCGLIYYMLVPSMYLLLQIYSCFNLNNVSWGTREVAAKQKKKTREELEEEKRQAEAAKKAKKKDGFLGFLTRDPKEQEDEGSIEFSLAGLFKIMCCVHPVKNTQADQLTSIANSLDLLKKRFETIEDHMGITPTQRRRSTLRQRVSLRPDGGLIQEAMEEIHLDSSDNESEMSGPKEERDDLVNPYWMEDKDLKRGEVDYMPNAEVQFFKDLIEMYLKPLIKDEAKEKKSAAELKELRNMAVFAFSMMNAVFVVTIFLLQMHQDVIYILWPLGVKTNITFIESGFEVSIANTYLKLEPIGLVFVVFFAIIMGIQFTGMLLHRFGTISHILASTELTWCTRKAEDMTEDAYIQRNAVNIVKGLQKLKGIDGVDDDGEEELQLGRRKTIHNLEKHRQNKQAISTLDVAFKKRFFSISAEATADNESPMLGNIRRQSMRRDTLRALAERRESVVQERRMSRVARRTSFAVDVEEIP